MIKIKFSLQLWQLKKNKLDQCLQLRMFEQDCEKVTLQLQYIILLIVFTTYFIITFDNLILQQGGQIDPCITT